MGADMLDKLCLTNSNYIRSLEYGVYFKDAQLDQVLLVSLYLIPHMKSPSTLLISCTPATEAAAGSESRISLSRLFWTNCLSVRNVIVHKRCLSVLSYSLHLANLVCCCVAVPYTLCPPLAEPKGNRQAHVLTMRAHHNWHMG